MKCAQCIFDEARGWGVEPTDAVTIYKGSALCSDHAVAELRRSRRNALRTNEVKGRMAKASA